MSKLYNHYVILKIQNPEKIYLFKCGLFYIFIHDDAIIMSKLLDLKLTNLNSVIKKCGFPINSGDKYFNILKNMDCEIEIVTSDDFSTKSLNQHIISKSFDSIVADFLKLDIDELSISQAFNTLHEFQDRFNKAKESWSYEKKRKFI